MAHQNYWYSINGSVHFIGISDIWGSGLLYIDNLWAHVEATWWGSSGVTISNGNTGSSKSGLGDLLIPLCIEVEIEMDPSTPVLLISCGVLLVHVLLDLVSTYISFTAIIYSVCGVSLIVKILKFFVGVKTDTSPMVRQLKNIWSKITLLV